MTIVPLPFQLRISQLPNLHHPWARRNPSEISTIPAGSAPPNIWKPVDLSNVAVNNAHQNAPSSTGNLKLPVIKGLQQHTDSRTPRAHFCFLEMINGLHAYELALMLVCGTFRVNVSDFQREIASAECHRYVELVRTGGPEEWQRWEAAFAWNAVEFDPYTWAQVNYVLQGPFFDKFVARWKECKYLHDGVKMR